MLAVIAGFCLAGGLSGYTAFITVGSIAPVSALLFLAVSARCPLFYVIDSKGIALKVGDRGSNLSGLGGAAASYWIDFRRSPVTNAELHHWRQQPALLVRTQKNPRGYIVPFEHGDVEKAQKVTLISQTA